MRQYLLLGLATVVAGGWIEDSATRALAEQRTKQPIPKYVLDLDLPAEERWDHIAKDFVQNVPAMLDYLNAFLPKWARPLVEKIGEDIEPFFKDFGGELVGLSKAMGAPLGDLVALNLVYQIEHIGLNCSNWNNTGPVGDDDAIVDPTWKKGCQHNETADAEKGPGLCTSVVAQSTGGNMLHGRNLDWNLEGPLLDSIVDVDFRRGNKTVFVGTTIVGFVGVLNGMRPEEFSWSLNARKKGGKLGLNVLEALLRGNARTPAQEGRFVLQGGSDKTDTAATVTYKDAVTQLSHDALVNDAYFIVAGTQAQEGAVISRNRNTVADLWELDTSHWYLLETNYDHTAPVPKADDRRTPGVAHMNALTESNVNVDGMLGVLSAWPTYNSHTDITAVMSPFDSTYQSYVWRAPEKK